MSFLTNRNVLVPTFLFIPFLYLIGWLLAKPFQVFGLIIENADLALLGTFFSFILFLLLLPSWVKIRWKSDKTFYLLGLTGFKLEYLLLDCLRGIFYSSLLLLSVLTPLLFFEWGHWSVDVQISDIINTICLGFGVAFAEELIFRGWLLIELTQRFGVRRGIFLQALIFSLVHSRFALGFVESFFFLTGLLLLGLILGQRRLLDNYSLFGAIGLHGGLVGGWFFLNTSFIEVNSNAPFWLIGPGGANPNPIGGCVAIFLLLCLLLFQRTALAIGGRPLRGARNASSKGAIP